MLCSVAKHAGSGRARKKCTKSSVSLYYLSGLPLPKCFTTEERTVQAPLFVYDKDFIYFPAHSANFFQPNLFSE